MVVARRNKHAMFYSIFSNNCQHFILDLCEYIKIDCGNHTQIDGGSISSTHGDLSEVQELQRDLGLRSTTRSSNIQSLWVKSRLVMLLRDVLYLVFGVMPALVSMLAYRLSLSWRRDCIRCMGRRDMILAVKSF